MFDQEEIGRFWSFVDKSDGPGGCWFYAPKKEHITGDGRLIVLQVGKGYKQAYRFAYESVYGSLPKGYVIRHRCAVGECCNPSHLVQGTKAENAYDWAARKWAGIPPGTLATYEDLPEWVPPPFR